MRVSITFVLAALALVSGAPILRVRQEGTSVVTAEQIIQAAPDSATCSGEGEFAAECRTAEQAAPFISAAFEKHEIQSVGEKAALLSLMAFETGSFKFDRNHFPPPGRPGQGTRNPMLFPFVYEFALETPAARDQALTLAPDPTTASPDVQNQILELVLPDETSFETAAWFLKTKCDPEISEGLKTGGVEGWKAYIATCVGTDAEDATRLQFFNQAVEALSGGAPSPEPSPEPPTSSPVTPPSAGQAGFRMHVVQAGDSCEQIAEEQGTTIDAILTANTMINDECTNLIVGQVLTF